MGDNLACLAGNSGFGSDSIAQGQTSLRNIQEYIQYVPQRLQLLQVTSSPALQSVNEGLSADNSLHRSQNNIKVQVSQNENAFNTALLKYANLSKNYADSLLHHTEDPGEIAARARLHTELSEANQELIYYAQAISNDMGQIRVTDQKLRKEIQKQQQDLQMYIQSLTKERKRIDHSHYGVTTASAQEEDSLLFFNSRRAQYIVWLFITVAVLALTGHYILTGEMSSLVVVSFLLLIFLVAKWYAVA